MFPIQRSEHSFNCKENMRLLNYLEKKPNHVPSITLLTNSHRVLLSCLEKIKQTDQKIITAKKNTTGIFFPVWIIKVSKRSTPVGLLAAFIWRKRKKMV